MPQGNVDEPRPQLLVAYNYYHGLIVRPNDDAMVTVTCSGKQGALLSLPLPAEREDTIARGDFGKWLVRHIDDCMKIADDLGLGINRMEDIILVTGRHLARSWVSVLFSEYRTGARVSFVAQPSGNNSGVRLQERSMTGGDLKLGPSGEVSFLFHIYGCRDPSARF